ncbi:MAG: pyrroloquinoline quinone-dependent dehydrogenase [Myxococcales bacterium]
MRRCALLLLAAACSSSGPHYAVTQHARPFDEMDVGEPRSAPAVAASVDFARLRAARSEPQNWLTYHGAYDAQRYSALDAIDARTVKNLRAAWVFQAGVIGLVASPATYSMEATPIVVDGVMYVSGWDGYVWALDAATGALFWRYRHAVPLDTPLCCGNVNRGVAVARGKVFYATQNGHLLALDAATGKLAWEQPFVDVRAGESATLAPLAVKDAVVVGSSGGEYGVRGHIDAFAADSGKRLWRRYTIPRPGDPGSESWPKSNAWERGGGTAWVTGSYDPDLDLLYWGTGNASPVFDGGSREGDDLFTDSILALSPSDGSIRWHFQTTPHDVWDYDGVNESILFESGGQKLLAHFDKNGYLFVLDRTNGKLVRAVPFARTTWGEIDASGKVSVKLVPTKEGARICPGPAGAKEWPHAAYSPRTRLLYVPVIEKCGTFKTQPGEFNESLPYWGGSAEADEKEGFGHVKAIDPLTGREAWSVKRNHPMLASMLATAGDVVFTGEPTGEFDAFDARTGELLWQFRTGSGIHASPITYSVKGVQYVAVFTGWGGWMKGFAPELYGGSRGSALFAFALP